MSDQSNISEDKSNSFGVKDGLIVAVVLLGIGAFGYLVATRKKRPTLEPKISRYGMIGDFTLTDHHSAPFTRQQLDGKVWVANFIFTSCATECPLISRRMSDIQNAFAHDPRVSLVSISIDPRTDHPDRLAKWAQDFDAGEKWSFLTGDTTVIKHLCTKGFMVVTPEAPAASSLRRSRELLHSEKIAVVDQLGVVRFFANGMNPKSPQQIIGAVSELLAAGN